MKKIQVAIIMFIAGILLFGCKKQETLLHIDDSGDAPDQITDVKVIRQAGGAAITYKVPVDPNILYVKAVYKRLEETVETKVSIFHDTLFVSGFGDTLVHQIDLYSVGKNTKESEPVRVDVRPLQPPVHAVFNTLTLDATFGGPLVTFKNDSRAQLAIVVMADTSGNNSWKELGTDYTEAEEGFYAVRGLDTVNTKFAVYIRDRWNNKSDTIFKSLKPLYEKLIDKSKFKSVSLPTDISEGHVWSKLTPRIEDFMWNDTWNNSNDVFHTKPSLQQMPQWFTFDMGAIYSLSRFKFYHREGSSGAYVGGDPKVFEVYGSTNPDPDGGWNNWTLLGTFTSIKPSGPGPVTSEDKQFAVIDGEDFTMPPGGPPVRYLRFKVLQTWGDLKYIFISELTFWGASAD